MIYSQIFAQPLIQIKTMVDQVHDRVCDQMPAEVQMTVLIDVHVWRQVGSQVRENIKASYEK